MIELIVELLGGLGLGGQLATAASIGAIGWYTWRAGALAAIVASVLGSLRLIVIGLAVVLAFGVAIGWIDLAVGEIVSDVVSWGSRIPSAVGDVLAFF
jgi:hypothetical protein